jgi:hypothetical protein
MSVAAANYAVNVCNLQDVAAKMVLTVLAWRAPKETPNEASMTVAMLQERSGLRSRNGVKDALRRLIDAGEIKVLRAGGPGTAAKYQLLRVGQHLEVSASDRSATDPYGSNGDTYGSNGDAQVSASDPYKTNRLSKTINTSAAARAPAISSPSLPISEKAAPKPKKAPAPKFDPASIPLPHGLGFQKWWLHFVEHRSNPIKGRRNPLTPLAAKIILGELAAVNEQQAVESIKKCIAAGWVKPFPPEPPAKPTLVTLPPQGAPKQTALERSLAEMREQFAKENAA